MSERITVLDELLDTCTAWRSKAIRAWVNSPHTFQIVLGCTLEEYLGKLDRLATTVNQLKAKIIRDEERTPWWLWGLSIIVGLGLIIFIYQLKYQIE